MVALKLQGGIPKGSEQAGMSRVLKPWDPERRLGSLCVYWGSKACLQDL